MLIFLAIMLLAVFGLSYYFWPKDQRSLKLALCVTGFAASLVGISIMISRALPITRQEHVEKVITRKYVNPPKIVYQDRIVYRAPDGEVAPVDVKGSCEGKNPIQLLYIQEQTDKKPDGTDDGSTTFISAHPIGSKVIIACSQPGAFSSFWKVGDIVQFVRGTAQ